MNQSSPRLQEVAIASSASSEEQPSVVPLDWSLEDLLLFALEGRLIDTYCFDGAHVLISIDGRHLRCLIPHVRSWLESTLRTYHGMMANALPRRQG